MITNGEEDMPAFKDKMSAPEIAEMVRFVRKEFQGK
jgi:mono/diheme cytochrome c family protein